MNQPRCYLVETKSGGQVKASFIPGEIYLTKRMIGGNIALINRLFWDVPHCMNASKIISADDAKAQGYNNHKFAIEINHLRIEKFDLGVVLKYKPQNYYNNGGDAEYVNGAPQSFTYIHDVYTGTKAILVSIDKKWLDMILEQKKRFEFRNKLPKLLLEEL